ncbi:endonuclease [Geobacillus thermoleovorans]|uniref:5'-nucleotidase n=1 Tax=Geobacillus proteiniphilus TaxID=860353 RepID=A0A1Q5SKJ2_9BACL|nr:MULTISPECIES: DUF6359 domain-containing protein [Geobacillus]ODA17085.1 endonuclease [Geobacillus thermoleovorans]OKO88538.1 5'-nucleotidase [Geobacillus proteiniphilus]OQP11322.1 endonuclease [Geobacillus thermoleovorans]QNU20036.1 chitobiase/beta-hexosaminidase C-terminal domain-containing protein [Geobacillus thermoleovorans]
MKSKRWKTAVLIAWLFALALSLLTPAVSRADGAVTVAEAIARNSGTATVEGYIVGVVQSGSGASVTYSLSAPFTVETNIALADRPNETDRNKILPVQLPPGAIREALNLKAHPENVGKKVRITGSLAAYFAVPGLKAPTAYSWVESATSRVEPVTAAPGPGAVPEGTFIRLVTATEGATIYYTVDGSEPTTSSFVYREPIPAEAMTIKAFAVKEGMEPSVVSVFTYSVLTQAVRIHDIQGVGHRSPWDGKQVTGVEGIVTYVPDSNHLYMQDPKPDNDERTSEGIFVYKPSHGAKPGDMVLIDGTVTEWLMEGYAEKADTDLTVTEIDASKGSLRIVQSGQPLPAPVVIGRDRALPTEVIDNDGFSEFDPNEDGIDFFESLEGMLVQIEEPKVIGPQKYGQIPVVPQSIPVDTRAGGLRLSENDANPERILLYVQDRTFVAKTGDSFAGPVTGVMSYRYGNYNVLVDRERLPRLLEGAVSPETTDIVPDPDQLTIASYNIENFSARSSDEKANQLADDLVYRLKSPDIIGLMEVQDNDGETDSGATNADQTMARLIQKVKERGGPDYVYIDVAPQNNQDGGAPGGNIRVGFLYNRDRVSLVDGRQGAATEAVAFTDGRLTLNPGRIDPNNPVFQGTRKPLAAQFEFRGQTVIIIANHFNSKNGDAPLFGKIQPPVRPSEAKRVQIAEVVHRFVQDVLEKQPNANVVVLGDLNDFEFSAAVKTLKGSELVNMMESVPADDRYSYIYEGNSQLLDHILVSKRLASSTKADIVHINAPFMEGKRASDHDPVLIQTSLSSKEETTPQQPWTRLANVSLNRLVVQTVHAFLSVEGMSSIRDGIWLQHNAVLRGEGLRHTKVVICPVAPGAVVDFQGAVVKEVVIANRHVKEIRGAEYVQTWNIADGVDLSTIVIKRSNGEPIHPTTVRP